MSTPTLLLIRGLPGSGKSTFGKMFSNNHGYIHLENDMWHMVDGVYQFDVSKVRSVSQKCQGTTEENLLQGKNVVVTNVFPHTNTIARYLRIATRTKAKFVVIHLTDNHGSIHDVPSEHIQDMQNRWGEWYGELKASTSTPANTIFDFIRDAEVPLPIPRGTAIFHLVGLCRGKYSMLSDPNIGLNERTIRIVNPDESIISGGSVIETMLSSPHGMLLSDFRKDCRWD